jgi:hypothetical protein
MHLVEILIQVIMVLVAVYVLWHHESLFDFQINSDIIGWYNYFHHRVKLKLLSWLFIPLNPPIILLKLGILVHKLHFLVTMMYRRSFKLAYWWWLEVKYRDATRRY